MHAIGEFDFDVAMGQQIVKPGGTLGTSAVRGEDMPGSVLG